MSGRNETLPRATSRGQLTPGRLLAGVTAGLVVGIIDIPVEIAMAALVFSGVLAGFVANGIGLFLFGALVLGVVVALTSSFRGMIALPQDSPAAILAVLAASIATGMPASASLDATFATVVAAIAIASLLTGLCFLALGRTRLGTLIRYIPYSVVGGFLAGTGWLLVRGALGVLTGSAMSLAQLPSLLEPDVLLRWLPALVFAVLMLVILRRHSHFLIIPCLLLAAIGLFYAVLWLTGTSFAEAVAGGWLLGPLPSGAIWQPLLPADLVGVYWPAVLSQAGNIATVVLVSVISLLLNTSGLELAARRDIDLNCDLRASGLANLLAALGGGPAGYQALSLSTLAHRMGGESRIAGVAAGLVCGAMLFFGTPLLNFFPKPVLGGLLLFLGLAFLVEWVYDAWFKLSPAEYMVVIAILLAMSALGLLPGVALGLALAVILFVVSYSRVSIVKHTLTGASYHSNVDRSSRERALLDCGADCLMILELQGYIFFGTANRLFEQVRRFARQQERTARFVVLDFRQVTGVDASAVFSFAKMVQLARAEGMVLVFTRLTNQMRRRLSREVLTETDGVGWHVATDLDHGVEWCEDRLLAGEDCIPDPGAEEFTQPAWLRLRAMLAEASRDAGLQDLLVRMDVPEGTVLIHQENPPCGLYVVERGQVSAERTSPDGDILRLRVMGAGAVIGEMSVYSNTPTSATVVATQPSTIYFLSVDALSRLEKMRPDVAIALHRYSAALLAERLAHANETVHAVLS